MGSEALANGIGSARESTIKTEMVFTELHFRIEVNCNEFILILLLAKIVLGPGMHQTSFANAESCFGPAVHQTVLDFTKE